MATLQVKALFDCDADKPGELSFKEDDILVDVIESNEPGWYEGRLENSSERGLFPFNYVEIVKPSFTTQTRTHCFTVANQSGGKPENSDTIISERFRVDLKKRNTPSPRLSSEDKIAVKESKELTPTISPLRATPRRTEEIPKSGIRATSSNVLERLQQKSVGIRQEISSRAQSYSTPSSTKYVKVSPNMISQPFQQRRDSDINKQEDGNQLIGIHHVQSAMTTDDQLVKPSHLRNRENPINTLRKTPSLSSQPPPLSPRPNITIGNRTSILTRMDENLFKKGDTDANGDNKLLVSSPKNPMPPLPSRPTSVASRKAHANRNSNPPKNTSRNALDLSRTVDAISPSSDEENKNKKENLSTSPIGRSISPAIKPKPDTLRPALPLRSNSNQSPGTPKIENKPSLLSSKSDDALETKKKCPPILSPKPVILISKKPPPPPKPAKSSRTRAINCQSPANENHTENNSAPVDNKVSSTTLGKVSLAFLNDKKKAPPPPPPSRSPRCQKQERNFTSTARYEILFETIQDNGYIDEDVARTIWRKNKLSKEDMDSIWRECDSNNKKLLDKDAFMTSMRMIDTLIVRQEHHI